MTGELYAITNRKLIKQWPFKHCETITLQFVAVLPLFMIGLISLMAYYWLIISQSMLLLCAAILTLEVFNQECFRLLISLRKNVEATILYLIRSSSWVVFVFLKPEVTLEDVYLAWLVCLLISAFGSVGSLSKELTFSVQQILKFIKNKRFTDLVKITYFMSINFFIVAVLYKGLNVFDKAVVELVDSAALASYGYFLSLASIPMAIASPLVFQFSRPRLVKAVSAANEYDKELRIVFTLCCIIASASFVFFVLFLDVLLAYVDKQSFRANSWIFYVLLLGQSINLFNTYFQLQLYATKKDKSMLMSEVYASTFAVLVAAAAVYLGSIVVSILTLPAYFAVSLIFKKRAIKV